MCCKSDTPEQATQTWKLITVIEVIKVLWRTCRKCLGNIRDGITQWASGGGLWEVSWWVQLQITESFLAGLNREGFNVVN